MLDKGKKYYRVLAINGGGVRGIIPAVVLQEFEKQSGKNITELFDYVIGTSIGGIISSGLTIPSDDGMHLQRAQHLLIFHRKLHIMITIKYDMILMVVYFCQLTSFCGCC